MKTVLIRIEPPDVDIEDVEDFLATDDLFVEYFNNFLSLPTFPEPLCFNKETGGFEVVSDARKALAKQIKEALRSQKRTPQIYRVVKKHSYIDIPLIPIELPSGPENVEINTSFTVTTLNKEQGIHWIKAERLPAFLESDLYLEFRMAKLMSQARIIGDQGEFVLMKIDFKPRIKKVKKKKEEEEVKIDPKEALMQDLYVCMGNASSTETDAWYATAQMAQQTESTYSASLSRPTSSSTTLTNPRPVLTVRPVSARPASAYSDQLCARPDSGMGSSVLGASARATSYSSVFQSKPPTSTETEDEELMSRLFSGDSKSRSRTIDNICVVSKQHSQTSRPFSATVYSCSKPNIKTDKEDICDHPVSPEDVERDDSGDSGRGDEGDETITDLNLSIESDSSAKGGIVFQNIDDVGAVIVGTVLKRALATLSQVDDTAIEANEDVRKIFPDSKYCSLTLEALDKIVLQEEPPKPVEDKEELKVHVPNDLLQKRAAEESDVDSLLDSEEDYEEADDFFRTHKSRSYSLATRKGIEQFKRFLQGTHGERNWNLWIDIDRMRLMNNEEELQLYLSHLRERYHLAGAPQELTVEQKTSFGLTEAASYTRDKLLALQNKIVEPLVLYWAPRFLLKQLMHTKPDRNLAYLQQKLMKPLVNGAYPSPPTATLLPLRPKSCHPRVHQGIKIEPQHFPMESPVEMPDTSPPVGLKRRYGEPTLQFLARWHRDQHGRDKKLLSSKLTVEKTSTPRIRSPASVRSSASPSTTPRPKSARPASVKSTSSRVSVESATGRVRLKSPSTRPKTAKPQQRSPATTLRDFGRPGLQGGQTTSRPSSAASSIRSEGSSGVSESSQFLGGRRMETLLQALFHEADAGGFFRRYIERSGNTVWVYNMNLWRDLQDYHSLFYQKSIDAYVLHKKAKMIFSQYIVTGARHHIGCDDEIADHIYKRLDPPFEDLFDDAEEHAITVLHEAWQQMIEVDQKTYGKVELIEIKRRLETRSKYVLNLQKRGLIKERVSTPDDTMEGYEDPVYDEALLQQVPDEFKDYTLEKLVHNRIELEHFRNFLADNYASMDILCWMDIEAFRRITHTEEKKRDAKAKEIKAKYLNKKYFFGPNSPAGKEGQEKVVEAGGGWGKLLEDRPPSAMLLEAQKYVQERLEKKWLPLFLVTPEFAVRQKPRTSMDDVVDDVLVQKRKKSQAVYKLLESRWVSSSKEIMIFRKALLNPVTNLQFRRFVSIKGDKLENDVLFWLEVQKFKELYHAHSDDSLILQKINTIVNCFVDSQIPPSLQIDILPDVAEKILERKYERSPYLFREAQLMVFKVLFAHWNDFCEFRSNLAEEKIMPLIERRRKHAKAKERARQLELEEKQARYEKEAERRAALGLPPLGEDEDVFQDPFKSADAESGEGDGEHEDRDKICWTYSNYMNALEKEELLNNTDESSFSSLLADSDSVKGSAVTEQDGTSNGSKRTAAKTVSKADSDVQTDKKKGVTVQNGKKSDSSVKGAARKRSSKDGGSVASSVTDFQMTSQRKSTKQAPALCIQPEKTAPSEGKVKSH